MKRSLFFFCLLFLFVVRLGLCFVGPPENVFADRTGRISVYGTVEKKERKQEQEVFYLKDVGFTGTEISNEKIHMGLICYAREEMPPVGAVVFVSGELMLYPQASNPGEFDMRNYYLYQGYGGRLNEASWEWKEEGWDHWKEGLWRIRCYLGKLYDMMLPEEDASVMKAMVLGDKGDLSAELKDLYRVNGISHILAISGLHISILGMGLYRGLRKLTLPILPSAALSVFLMVNYAVLTGAGTSTLRAVIMFAMMAIADIERRSYDLPTALGLSAASTVVSNPYLLMTSAFWLSYAAVAGVAVFGTALLEGVRDEYPGLFRCLQGPGAGVAVTVFTLPLILQSYYEMPLYSVFLNLLVIPLMSVLMVCGIIMLPIGMLWLPAGIVTGLPCHGILYLYRSLCEWIESLPGHTLITGYPAVWQMGGAYLLFVLVIVLTQKRWRAFWERRAKKYAEIKYLVLLRCLIVAAALFVLLLRIPPAFRLTMLDVGQGDGFCFESENMVLMIDGGSTSKKELYQYQLEPFLKYRGIARVDYWFLTHPDRDHCSGLTDMLSDEKCNIRIGTLVLPEAEGAAEDFSELIALAEGKGIRILWNAAGSHMERESLQIDCLHPVSGYRAEDVNAYSQILQIHSTHGFSGIFTGDATTQGETAALQSAAFVPADVLKLGHHGSSTATSEEWLAAVSPRLVLISCGRDNPYGHPHAEVLGRVEAAGCKVCRTDRDGAVTILAKDGRLYVECFLEE